jgi:hypothetical protein
MLRDMDGIKRIVKKTPVVRDLARVAMRHAAARKASTFDSQDYWESRYRDGRNSGAGSYNRLAQFKAEVLNRFVADHRISRVIEFGSGDGSQLRLCEYPNYIGVDVSRTAVESTRRLYSGDETKTFIHTDDLAPEHRGELSLSLDVIYHLVEDSVFETYMERLFESADRFVIIYSSNEERRADSVHVRHRRFTDWIERNRPEFRQIGFLRNPFPEDVRDLDNTSFADFYIFERVADPNHQ